MTARREALEHAKAGRAANAINALQAILKQAPEDLGSLLLLGDLLHMQGNTSAAGKSYRAAIAIAETYEASLPDQARIALQRAKQRVSTYIAGFMDELDGVFPKAGRSSRFDESLNILMGKQPVYVQQPRRYYFPGLPQIDFYDTGQFDWVPALEAKTAEIRAELQNVLTDEGDKFHPYIERKGDHLNSPDHPLLDNRDWSAFYLWRDGKRIEENCARCPVTAAAIERTPLDFAEGKCPSVLFSVLKPGAHIPPHNGMLNTRLICHLPLIVPGPAWLRVGSRVHHWQEGRAVIFDDTIEHEAKNEADRTRIVLLFDIWRPELTDQERREVSALLGNIPAMSDD